MISSAVVMLALGLVHGHDALASAQVAAAPAKVLPAAQAPAAPAKVMPAAQVPAAPA